MTEVMVVCFGALGLLVFACYKLATHPTHVPVHNIQPGQRWLLRQGDDPWGSKVIPPVTILDVRGSWVRYRIGDGSLFLDERRPAREFCKLYQLLDDNTHP